MHIESQLTKKAYWKINVLSSRSLVMATLMGLFLVFVWTNFRSSDTEVIVTNIIAVICLYYLSIFVLLLISTVRITHSRLYEPFFERQQFDFGGEEVLISSESGQSKIPWSAFQKWRHTSGYYLLFNTPVQFYGINEKDVPAGMVSEFESLLTSKIGKRVTN